MSDSLQKEIDRRVDIYKEFKGQRGVLINFMRNFDKDYVFLCDSDIDDGLYATNSNGYIYVKECSWDVLYNLDQKQLDIVRKCGKNIHDLDLLPGYRELYEDHRNMLNQFLSDMDMINAHKELEIMTFIADNDMANYVYAMLNMHSAVFLDEMKGISKAWLQSLKRPFTLA